MGKGINVTVWGTRGSMTALYQDRIKYGANTSCISAEWDDQIVLFDCGSGVRAFGMDLLKRKSIARKELHIFISHLHLDHIMGLPFFPLIFLKDWTIHFYGSSEENTTFQKELTEIMGPPYWPVSLENAGAQLYWHQVRSGDIVNLPDQSVVRVLQSNHPNATVIYRLDIGDKHIVYGLDYELTDECQRSYECFIKDSSIVFFDGMYTEDELPNYRGFGHSCWEQGISLIDSCNIGLLCISHHDWGRNDSDLEVLEQKAKSINPKCCFAKEGMTIHMEHHM